MAIDVGVYLPICRARSKSYAPSANGSDAIRKRSP